MKVEVIGAFYTEDFVKAVNEFIKDKKIIDIKYFPDEGSENALIMYEEE